MSGQFLSVQILGTSFSLKSEESLDYLQEVVDHYKQRIEETQKSVSLADPLKIALLTGIILTDELLKERLSPDLLSQQDAEEAGKITKALIEKIEAILA